MAEPKFADDQTVRVKNDSGLPQEQRGKHGRILSAYGQVGIDDLTAPAHAYDIELEDGQTVSLGEQWLEEA